MTTITLSVRACAAAAAVIWGSAVALVGVGNLLWPGYGAAFLQVVSSVYPGYHAQPTLGSVAVGTLYAVVDGAIGGGLLAWLCNRWSAGA